MKPVTAIFLTILYAAFSCCTVSGFTALNCQANACKSIFSSYSEKGLINTDNEDKDCHHKPAVTAHVIHKHSSTTDSGGNKYVRLDEKPQQRCAVNGVTFLNSSKPISKAALQTYPLFIKHCVLLI